MNNIIATQKPNGEWVYLPEDFISSLSSKYFDTGGLGVIPFLAPLVAGAGSAGAATGAGATIAKVAGTALKILPNLLTNNFWKDAGPAVQQLSQQAKNQLDVAQAVSARSEQLVKASDQQNQALVNYLQSQPDENDTGNGKTALIIGGVAIVLGGGAFALWKLNKKKSKLKKSES